MTDKETYTSSLMIAFSFDLFKINTNLASIFELDANVYGFLKEVVQYHYEKVHVMRKTLSAWIIIE